MPIGQIVIPSVSTAALDAAKRLASDLGTSRTNAESPSHPEIEIRLLADVELCARELIDLNDRLNLAQRKTVETLRMALGDKLEIRDKGTSTN